MAVIKKFEDLIAWQKARELTSRIYEISGSKPFFSDKDLQWDLRKTSRSIMNNLAEGFDRAGNKEFGQFLYIAKGSAGELKSILYVCLDRSLITNKEFGELVTIIDEISRIINGLKNYLLTTPIKGTKYR